ncbi:MAG: neuromedin U, partial [Planctomycetota bacterium]
GEMKMNSERFVRLVCALLALVAVMLTGSVLAQEADDADSELAKKTQNPVADLISVPFQNNINFEVGDGGYTQNILNIQPVYPVHLDDQWNLITRTIVPVVHQPPLIPGTDRECGLGDIQFTAFLSPRDSGGLIWGTGPVFRFDTATDETLGQEKWSAGPSVVALKIEGPWVYGALVQNLWSYAGDSDRAHVNEFLLQPFINHNLPHGWYLSSSPIITCNWKADSGNRWTVPVGGGIGKIVRFGKLPVNLSCQGFYNVESPRNGADWTLRLQMQLLFPK